MSFTGALLVHDSAIVMLRCYKGVKPYRRYCYYI